jgi:lysophospholipase L1-like esterase
MPEWVSRILAVILYYIELIRLALHLLLVDGRASKINRGPAFRNTLVILGDDIAYGIGDTKNIFQVPGLASKLKTILEKTPNIKQTWDIYNCGVPNSTSRDWLPSSEKKTADMTLFERVFQVKKYQDAKIVILMVGYNDGRNASIIKPHETLDNIASICKVLLNMGKEVYVCPILNHADHKLGDLYGDNLERNELIISYCSNESRFFRLTRSNLHLGPLIHNLNYEYKGDFLYTPDGQFLNARGYLKFGKDFAELLTNHMVKMEFKQFKERLGM